MRTGLYTRLRSGLGLNPARAAFHVRSLDVLKLYYPSFSKATLDMMVKDAKEVMDAIDRRRFVTRAKGTYAERLRLAFSKCSV